MPIKKRSAKLCSTPECSNTVNARGFCSTCYYKKIRYGEIQTGTQTGTWKHRLTNIDAKNKTATCATCGEVKIAPRNKDATQWRCSVPANAKSKERKRICRQVKKDQLKKHCEICFTQQDLCWDHDHTTGDFRGTLCSKCNTGIGFMRDDVKILQQAIIYLEKAKTSVVCG